MTLWLDYKVNETLLRGNLFNVSRRTLIFPPLHETKINHLLLNEDSKYHSLMFYLVSTVPICLQIIPHHSLHFNIYNLWNMQTLAQKLASNRKVSAKFTLFTIMKSCHYFTDRLRIRSEEDERKRAIKSPPSISSRQPRLTSTLFIPHYIIPNSRYNIASTSQTSRSLMHTFSLSVFSPSPPPLFLASTLGF